VAVLKPAAEDASALTKITHDSASGYASTVFSFALDRAKDTVKSHATNGFSDLKEQIDSIMSGTVDMWKDGLVAAAEKLFNGQDDTLEVLTSLLQDGFSYKQRHENVVDFKTQATKFLFSAIIPEVWRIQGYNPVLLNTERECEASGVGVGQWTGQTNDFSVICYQNTQYQLWAVKGRWTCEDPNDWCIRPKGCNHYLTAPPGIDFIRDKRHEFGGMDVFSLTGRQAFPTLISALSANDTTL
jgi:hypothetical protein